MKLSEVFSQLAYGELSQLALGEITDEELNEEAFAPLLAHVNMGLLALYKRFNLKEGRLVVTIDPLSTEYKLAATDLLKIERVQTAEGTDLALNDGNDPLSCFTPQMGTLRIASDLARQVSSLPDKYRTGSLIVVYRAAHGRVVGRGGVIIPETIELDLPYSHLEALLYFVASRVHNPIGMVNEFNAGNNYAAKYEVECQRLEALNLENDEATENTRIERNGWV